MRSLLLALLATLATTGCDQFLPSAGGTVTLSPDSDADGFSALEVHWDGAADDHYVEVILAPFQFPESFSIGGGCCGPGADTYRLSAWLSNGTQAQPTTEPENGAPSITQTIVVADHRDTANLQLVLTPYVAP